MYGITSRAPAAMSGAARSEGVIEEMKLRFQLLVIPTVRSFAKPLALAVDPDPKQQSVSVEHIHIWKLAILMQLHIETLKDTKCNSALNCRCGRLARGRRRARSRLKRPILIQLLIDILINHICLPGCRCGRLALARWRAQSKLRRSMPSFVSGPLRRCPLPSALLSGPVNA